MRATTILLLIRPEGQSKRLLSECEAVFGGAITAVISPVIRIERVDTAYDPAAHDGLILTSVNAVRNAHGLAGNRLYCVGNRTCMAAEAAGGEVIFCAPTAAALVKQVKGASIGGKMLWLRGKHVSSDIENELNLAGIETVSAIIYDQVAQAPGVALREAISGDMPAILPLYSQRSACLLGRDVDALGTGLHVIAISDSVARAWQQETGANCEICDAPDAGEMIDKIDAALRR